jgi:hypothetical protein
MDGARKKVWIQLQVAQEKEVAKYRAKLPQDHVAKDMYVEVVIRAMMVLRGSFVALAESEARGDSQESGLNFGLCKIRASTVTALCLGWV